MNHQLTKELVRAWLHKRQVSNEPPPDMEQIRCEVGWNAAKTEHEKTVPTATCPRGQLAEGLVEIKNSQVFT